MQTANQILTLQDFGKRERKSFVKKTLKGNFMSKFDNVLLGFVSCLGVWNFVLFIKTGAPINFIAAFFIAAIISLRAIQSRRMRLMLHYWLQGYSVKSAWLLSGGR